MCGHGGCQCGHGGGCGGRGHRHGGHHHGHGCHGEQASCACGGGCDCEQEAGGCQCGGDESQTCSCGHGGHGEQGEHHEHHGHHEEHGLGFHRRFISRAERLAELEGYLSELRDEIAAGQAYLQDVQAEASAVEERLAVLRAG
jgi:hypothetical protein